MSPHQQKQGYYPSQNSMFTSPPSVPQVPIYPTRGGDLYSQSHLPAPSAPVQAHSYHQPPPPPPMIPPVQSGQYPAYPGPSRPAPPVPTTGDTPRSSQEAPRVNDSGTPALKPVSLPKECLPRFIAIAKVNTENNKETCGLLLGKDKGHKFVVTTLLIPKQHATSDTCTMEEEELVLQFTEERALITLGWVRANTTLSYLALIQPLDPYTPFSILWVCIIQLLRRPADSGLGFMSSVDLHTHSGFQRMLPESFAVVCAPNSTPK